MNKMLERGLREIMKEEKKGKEEVTQENDDRK